MNSVVEAPYLSLGCFASVQVISYLYAVINNNSWWFFEKFDNWTVYLIDFEFWRAAFYVNRRRIAVIFRLLFSLWVLQWSDRPLTVWSVTFHFQLINNRSYCWPAGLKKFTVSKPNYLFTFESFCFEGMFTQIRRALVSVNIYHRYLSYRLSQLSSPWVTFNLGQSGWLSLTILQ